MKNIRKILEKYEKDIGSSWVGDDRYITATNIAERELSELNESDSRFAIYNFAIWLDDIIKDDYNNFYLDKAKDYIVSKESE